MFKRLSIVLIFFIIISCPALSESWDDFNGLERMWDGQKSITNKEFEQVMDALQEKNKQKEAKIKKKKIKKLSGGGTSLHSELNPEKEIVEIKPVKPNKDGQLLNISVDLILPNSVLEKGFYKVFVNKDEKDNKIYMSFYQSEFFKGKIEVNETKEDYDEELIDFVRLIPYNDSYVKLIFGSLDFNAYVFVPFVKDDGIE